MNTYITTTLPYVNANPHLGFALELVQADVLARYNRLLGYEVCFNTGVDEHGVKIYRKAQERGISPQGYCNEYADKFRSLTQTLHISVTQFIRTTDEQHKTAAQEFWKCCAAQGDIYKKNYRIKYCIGCEMEKTESELEDGRCALHPNQEIELIDEENYFFRFSAYQKKLLKLYEKNPFFLVPSSKKDEITNFVRGGLEDFSISRLKEKMPWGVPVPGDDDHVMYVWFDALVNYISTLGWPGKKDWQNWWPGIQLAGKDNLRQQTAMWQAMLMSAKIEPSRQVIIHGFITADGKKMSKSTGNVINPVDLVERYGVDPVRYYLLREIPTLGDGDFSAHRMDEIYNTELANELGNALSRITTLAEKDGITQVEKHDNTLDQELCTFVEETQFNLALEYLWKQIKQLNKDINTFEPWKKTSEERRKFLTQALQTIHKTGFMLQIFLPHTAQALMKSTTGTITKPAPLFPKIV